MLSKSTKSKKELVREPVDPDRYRIVTEMVKNGVGNNALAIAYGTLPRRDLAQDAVYNALEILLQMKQESFSKINILNRYFLRITKTQALKLKTQESRYSAVNDEDLVRFIDQEAEDATDSLFNDESQSVKLEVLITQLKPKHAEILRLFYFDDRSHREIGEILGITEDNSKMRLSRAMTALRKLYFSIHPDDDPGRGSGKKTSSAKDKAQHPRPARVPDRIKGNEILDYFMGDLKGLKKALIEHIIDEDDLYKDVLKGYQMLSKDFGGQENALQFLEDSRKQLLWKLKAHEYSDSDRAVNKTGASGDFGEAKILPINAPFIDWKTNRFLFKNQETDIEFPVFQYEFRLPIPPMRPWSNSSKLTGYLAHWDYICFIDLNWENRRQVSNLKRFLFKPHENHSSHRFNHLKTKDAQLPVFMVSQAAFQTNFIDYSKKPNDVANDFDSCLFIQECLCKLEEGMSDFKLLLPDFNVLLESRYQYLELNHESCWSVAVFLYYNKDGLKNHLESCRTGDKFLKYKTFGELEKEESKDFLMTTQRFLKSFLIPPEVKSFDDDKNDFSLCQLSQDIQHPESQCFSFLPVIITPKETE
jgi:RNA polymerase sigma-70 factor (ECF subfamily)